MTENWFCKITAGNKGFVRNRAEERRYKDALFRMAEREMAQVTDYVCGEGKIHFIISCADVESVRRIIKNTNASYGKYMRLMGENVVFDKIEPELVKDNHQYSLIKKQFFNTFYIAREL